MAAATRPPSRNRPRKHSATAMNAGAVPWPATTRSSMPTATVPSHAPMPAGTIAAGRRQARGTSSPTPSPTRNGQAVLARPPADSPWWWADRPIATKTSTQHTSMITATAGCTRAASRVRDAAMSMAASVAGPGEPALPGGPRCSGHHPGVGLYALPVETLTFLFTDIEGSTVMLRRLGEEAYARVLADHHRLIRDGLADHEGEEVGTHGNAFFAVFSSPKACVAAVTQIQLAIESHPWPAGERVRVRMGVHTGEAAKTVTGLVGLDVHRAARVAAVAYGGQVLMSETAAVLVRDWLPPGAALEDLGSHLLKDLGRPERIFQLGAAGLRAEFPPLRSLDNPALQNNLPAQLSALVGRERSWRRSGRWWNRPAWSR